MLIDRKSATFALSSFWKECKPTAFNPNNEQNLTKDDLKQQNAQFAAGQLEVYRMQNDFQPTLSFEQQKSVDIVSSIHSSYNDPELKKIAESKKEQQIFQELESSPSPSMS